ncbi:hypothetical protein [Pseudomonas arsenicoxydans]|uniref:Uncharacterized protein n=1 Tax=Pseudomonas arsenicoxydans TaxID=702115 RepID=A0A502GWR8_9PSED|nr:hypothetical protein [Pseudomonas arsenicoxydans]TPG65670.1 hypothetical protein EAH78_31695 [Pseudomonas arsenicoxydans]
MKRTQTCSLLLQRNPDHNLAIPCSARNLPLLETQDYARRSVYAHDNPIPVLVNNQQYYALLSTLARHIWDSCGEQTLLLAQVRMPSIDLALSANLLDPRVTMGAHLWNEALFWAHQIQTPVAWISAERIRRDLWDGGDNLLQIAAWNTAETPAITDWFLPDLDYFAAQVHPSPVHE